MATENDKVGGFAESTCTFCGGIHSGGFSCSGQRAADKIDAVIKDLTRYLGRQAFEPDETIVFEAQQSAARREPRNELRDRYFTSLRDADHSNKDHFAVGEDVATRWFEASAVAEQAQTIKPFKDAAEERFFFAGLTATALDVDVTAIHAGMIAGIAAHKKEVETINRLANPTSDIDFLIKMAANDTLLGEKRYIQKLEPKSDVLANVIGYKFGYMSAKKAKQTTT